VIPNIKQKLAAERVTVIAVARRESLLGQRVLGIVVDSPTRAQIGKRTQFTTTFNNGDEFQTFLVKTQPDVDTAVKEATR
jgi:hypothetical protein